MLGRRPYHHARRPQDRLEPPRVAPETPSRKPCSAPLVHTTPFGRGADSSVASAAALKLTRCSRCASASTVRIVALILCRRRTGRPAPSRRFARPQVPHLGRHASARAPHARPLARPPAHPAFPAAPRRSLDAPRRRPSGRIPLPGRAGNHPVRRRPMPPQRQRLPGLPPVETRPDQTLRQALELVHDDGTMAVRRPLPPAAPDQCTYGMYVAWVCLGI